MSFRHSNVSAGGVVSGTIKHATAALPPRVRSDSAARALQFVAPKWELTADPGSPGWKPLPYPRGVDRSGHEQPVDHLLR